MFPGRDTALELPAAVTGPGQVALWHGKAEKECSNEKLKEGQWV